MSESIPSPFIYTSILSLGFGFSETNVYRISKPPFHSLLLKLLFPSLSLSPPSFFLFLFLFSLCLSLSLPSLASLGAGSWILNPCGLLGGGFLFQFAWQHLKQHHHPQHHHHRSSKFSTQNYILSLFWLSFSSFSFFLSVRKQTPQTHPWPPPRFIPKGLGASWIRHQLQLHLQRPSAQRKLQNLPILHEENLEPKLMKFQAVQTLYRTSSWKLEIATD